MLKTDEQYSSARAQSLFKVVRLQFNSILTIGWFALVGCSPSPTSPTTINDSTVAVPTTDSTSTTQPSETNIAQKNSKVDPRDAQFTLPKDSATLPWLPPRASVPVSFEMLPPGGQAFLFLRPDSWLHSEAGQTSLEYLGNELEPIAQAIRESGKIDYSKLASVAIALFTGGVEGWPRVVLRLELKEPQPIEELFAEWGIPLASISTTNQRFLELADRCYFVQYLNSDQPSKVKQVTVGPKDLIQEMVQLDGSAAPLRRQMEILRQTTDSQADLTLLFAPGFLFTDGRKLLPTYAPNLLPALQSWLSRDMQAGLITTTLAPTWYGELRLMSAAEQDANLIVNKLRNVFSNLGDTLESSQLSEKVHPFGKQLVQRFPQMIRTLAKYQRTGIENGHVISNFYLPSDAAPNIILATWIAIQKHQPRTEIADGRSEKSMNQAVTIDELLDKPIQIVFDQESLEFALAAIADATNGNLPPGTSLIRMEILGAALERDGITRNQQVRDFQHRSVPLRTVLTDLVRRANPVTTVTSLSEADQKLIWIVTDDPKAKGSKMIQITTRKYAASNSLAIPTEFLSP